MDTLVYNQISLFSRTTWVSRYQKGIAIRHLNETRDGGVLGLLRHQPDHMQTIYTSCHTDNQNCGGTMPEFESALLSKNKKKKKKKKKIPHRSVLRTSSSSQKPNRVKALKANTTTEIKR